MVPYCWERLGLTDYVGGITPQYRNRCIYKIIVDVPELFRHDPVQIPYTGTEPLRCAIPDGTST